VHKIARILHKNAKTVNRICAQLPQFKLGNQEAT